MLTTTYMVNLNLKKIDHVFIPSKRTSPQTVQTATKYAPYFLYPDKDIMKAALRHTTCFGKFTGAVPMKKHQKTYNPSLTVAGCLKPLRRILFFRKQPASKATTQHKVLPVHAPHTVAVLEWLRSPMVHPHSLISFARLESPCP